MHETSTSLIAARLLLLNTFKQHLNNRRGHNYINKGGRHETATHSHGKPPRPPQRLGNRMNHPLIIYWSSNSGGTRRVAEALATKTVELADYDGVSPYVLMCPTYDQPRGGFTPKPVQTFLNKHAHLMVGVAGSGNVNFGEHYCQAAIDISKRHNIPIVHRIDIMGTEDDYRTIDAGMTQHWQTLLNMRGLTWANPNATSNSSTRTKTAPKPTGYQGQ